MPDFGPHSGFILGSYAATALILGWMIVSSVLENRAAQARLRSAELARAHLGDEA